MYLKHCMNRQCDDQLNTLLTFVMDMYLERQQTIFMKMAQDMPLKVGKNGDGHVRTKKLLKTHV